MEDRVNRTNVKLGTPEHEEAVAKLEEIAAQVDGDLMSDYSGRCMYGKLCYGIVAENDARVIEEAGERGIKGAKVDNMGLQYIVYWEGIEGVYTEEVL